MDYSKLKNLLDEQISWPNYYTFKFVIKSELKHKAIDQLEGHDVAERESRSGTYTSITSKKRFSSSEEVINVYKKMATVEGIISL